MGERASYPFSPRRRRPAARAAAILALVAFAALPCSAAGGAARRPSVLVLVSPSGHQEDPALGALIGDSIGMELGRRDMVASAASGPAADALAVAALARSGGADFAVWGVYSQSATKVSLAAYWIDAASSESLGSAARSGELNLSFDSTVAALVDELVSAQAGRLAAMAAAWSAEETARVAAAPAPERPPEVRSEPASLALPPAPALPAPSGLAPEPAAFQAPAPAERAAIIEMTVPRAAEPATFAVTLGSSPFITTFAAVDYSPMGLNVGASGLYRAKAFGGLAGIGGSTGLSWFKGRGAYTEADFFLVPFGLQLFYGTRTGSAVDFFLRLEGGPALFVLKPAGGSALSGLVPYISGGMGALLAISGEFGLSIDGAYSCFFADPAPIMGFSPGLSAHLRF